jgi:hypothetical protein
MMKANGINPNGGTSSPPAQSAGPSSTPKKGTTTSSKSKSSGGNGTGTSKKRAAASGDRGRAKKVKAETDAEDEAGGENSVIAIKEEADRTDASSEFKTQMLSKHDPFLSPGSDIAIGKASEEDAELFNEFCNTHNHSEEAGLEIRNSYSSGVKHDSFLADALGENEMPLVKEERDYA